MTRACHYKEYLSVFQYLLHNERKYITQKEYLQTVAIDGEFLTIFERPCTNFERLLNIHIQFFSNCCQSVHLHSRLAFISGNFEDLEVIKALRDSFTNKV